MMFTGDVISGRTAADWGLANSAHPADDLEAEVLRLALRIAGVPTGMLAMHKLVLNQVMQLQGLDQAQTLSTVFDGITRHNPEGMWFRRLAQAEGFKAAVEWRDSGRAIPQGDEARAAIAAMGQQRGSAD
jgi:enoyl-CoA hydratase